MTFRIDASPTVTAGAKIRAADRREDEKRRMHLEARTCDSSFRRDSIRSFPRPTYSLKPCRLYHHSGKYPINALLLHSYPREPRKYRFRPGVRFLDSTQDHPPHQPRSSKQGRRFYPSATPDLAQLHYTILLQISSHCTPIPRVVKQRAGVSTVERALAAYLGEKGKKSFP